MMGGNYLSNAGVMLVQVGFGFFILAVMLRFLLQIVRANFYNQVSQFLVKITNPALVPLRRLIPSVAGFDTASLVLLLILQITQLVLIALFVGQHLDVAGIIVLAIAKLLGLLVNVFFFAIIIQVILSWIRPGTHHPAMDLLNSLTEPLLGPARRLLPPISGFDLSPILVLLALRLVSTLLVAPLSDMGMGLLSR